MIVRMAKVEIAGPKELLLETIDLARQLSVLHLESDPLAAGLAAPLPPARLPGEVLEKRLFFETLLTDIGELLALLPSPPLRRVYLQPLPVLDIVAAKVAVQLPHCRELSEKQQQLRDEEQQLAVLATLLQAVQELVGDLPEETRLLQLYGVTFRNREAEQRLRDLLGELCAGRCLVTAAETPDGQRVGLVAVDSELGLRLQRLLADEQVPELPFPEAFADRPFAEKARYLQKRLQELTPLRRQVAAELEQVAHAWRPIYRRVASWLERRLALLEATASVYETGRCFVILGWMPAARCAELQQRLEARFAGRVTLESLKILERDLERVPVALMNPPYFRAYERLTKLLPLPRYTSFDPTPFLGLFFPLLFGMMLGDIGYGLLLALLAAGLLLAGRKRPLLHDAGQILLAAAGASIVFGLLFGECLGDWGAQAFGLEPLCFDRSEAFIPLLYFSLAVGFAHILLGMLLGSIGALLRRAWRDSAAVAVQMLLLGALGVLLLAFLAPQAGIAVKPLLLLIGIAGPLLLLLGGLLAPLELLKAIGNVISYSRIMAIGLTSVLLANIANRLGGRTGDLLAGLLVAGLLHAFNLLLGIFAPTIHALRLHYVEFFSKFLEPGGRQFRPLHGDDDP